MTDLDTAALDRYLTADPRDEEVDPVIEFIIDNADTLHYSTVKAIAEDFEYDFEYLLEVIRG